MSVQTERALAQSLIKLLSKKTLDKITVRDITDDCGVNRQTFYYHFHDVYDLVEWIFVDRSRAYMEDGITLGNWKNILLRIMSDLREDRSFTMNTYYSLTRRELDEFMTKLFRPAFRQLMDQVMEEHRISEKDQDFIVNIYTYAVVGVLTEWIASGMPEEFIRDLDRLYEAVGGTMAFSVENLEKADRSPFDWK